MTDPPQPDPAAYEDAEARHLELAAHLAEHPDDAEVWRRLGIALGRLGRPHDAVAAYRRALHLVPDLPLVRGNLGNALVRLGDHAGAIRAHRAEIARDPARADAWFNLGAALMAADRLEAAGAAFTAAIERSGGRLAAAHANLGSTLVRRNRPEDAIGAYRQAIDAAPDLAAAHYNLALCLLALGRFAEGWTEYEWRWRHLPPLSRRPPHPAPPWEGEDPSGLTLLVHAEQGLGDTIQFARYLPALAARGARVLLTVPSVLVRLLRQVPGVEDVIAEGQLLPAADRLVPIQSLPRLLRPWLGDVPPAPPFPAATPRNRAGGPPRVGLVWAGSPTHRNDRRRSLAPELLAPLLEVPGLAFVSLQTGPAQAQLGALGRPVPRAPGLIDFAATATVLAGLDLLITVDTAAAHLAGSLGRPAWVLLPHAPDWRWGLDRPRSPWYPSLTLHRQRRPGDWAEVIARVAEALRAGAV